MLEIKLDMVKQIKLSAKFIGNPVICAVYLTSCCEQMIVSGCVCAWVRVNELDCVLFQNFERNISNR